VALIPDKLRRALPHRIQDDMYHYTALKWNVYVDQKLSNQWLLRNWCFIRIMVCNTCCFMVVILLYEGTTKMCDCLHVFLGGEFMLYLIGIRLQELEPTERKTYDGVENQLNWLFAPSYSGCLAVLWRVRKHHLYSPILSLRKPKSVILIAVSSFANN
jgi:hypothetical protein